MCTIRKRVGYRRDDLLDLLSIGLGVCGLLDLARLVAEADFIVVRRGFSMVYLVLLVG